MNFLGRKREAKESLNADKSQARKNTEKLRERTRKDLEKQERDRERRKQRKDDIEYFLMILSYIFLLTTGSKDYFKVYGHLFKWPFV